MRRHRQARHLKLTLHAYDEHPILITAPIAGLREHAIQEFVLQHYSWIKKQIRSWLPPLEPRHQGAIPCLGKTVSIVYDESSASGAQLKTPDTLVIGGRASSFARHCQRWLQGQLLQFAQKATPALLEQMKWQGKSISLKIITAKSLWGSCHTGKLRISLNWRLALATEKAAFYVLAHELAHLHHPNHSPSFWSLTQRLCPYTQAQRDWLRAHKNHLYRWRFNASL